MPLASRAVPAAEASSHGRSVLDESASFVPSGRGRVRLTARQREVAALLTRGHSNREIGSSLEISERTVERHVQTIMRRLDARSRTEAAVLLATGRTERDEPFSGR